MKTLSHAYITGGVESGGVRAFSEALALGFNELNVSSEIISSHKQFISKKNKWQDPKVGWVLSTWGLVYSRFVKRAVGVAHGCPGIGTCGISKALAVSSALRFCAAHHPLISVSGYTGLHLHAAWNIKPTGFVYNPVRSEFHRDFNFTAIVRKRITYVGRLVKEKNVDFLVKAFIASDLQSSGFTLTIVGAGQELQTIKLLAGNKVHAEFYENLNAQEIQRILCETKIFFSGCPTESFGISLLEAYACGAQIVCPSTGGFIEAMRDQINKAIFTFPPIFTVNDVVTQLKSALISPEESDRNIIKFSAKIIAEKYLEFFEITRSSK